MYKIYIALLLGVFTSCARTEEALPQNSQDLSKLKDTYLFSGPAYKYAHWMQSMAPDSPFFRLGSYSNCVVSKVNAQEIVFSNMPYIGCLYAKVNGSQLDIYMQETKRRPEYSGYPNFIVHPLTETIMVQGSGNLENGEGEIHLEFSIASMAFLEASVKLSSLKKGGYIANYFWTPCE